MAVFQLIFTQKNRRLSCGPQFTNPCPISSSLLIQTLTLCTKDSLDYSQFPNRTVLFLNTVLLHTFFLQSRSPFPISSSSSPPLILMIQFQPPCPVSHQCCVPTYHTVINLFVYVSHISLDCKQLERRNISVITKVLLPINRH